MEWAGHGVVSLHVNDESEKQKGVRTLPGMNPNSWGRRRPIEQAPSLVLVDVSPEDRR
jgi:adenine-specific DNA methylase